MNRILSLFIVSLLCIPLNTNAKKIPRQKPLSKKAIASALSRTDITTNSLSQVGLYSQVLNVITPQMYGAVGDGNTDDTEALRQAIFASNRDSKILYFASGFKYKVSGSLNYFDGKYNDCTLNVVGAIPNKHGSYKPTEYGGIQLEDNVSLFKNAIIKGSIQNMSITGKRSDNVRLFDSCTCKGLDLTNNNISNFGAVFYDTEIRSVSHIINNNFYTVFYFARNDNTSAGCTDCTISFNYINGGKEKTDNTCFEWGYFNGSLVTNNFIDYYRCIYQPKAAKKQIFVGPVSSNNQYQVFRYFYAAGVNIGSISFYSYNDAFNWTDPSKIQQKYEAFSYVGQDGKTYEIPPYIAICKDSWKTTIKGARIERNNKTLVFVEETLTQYRDNCFDAEFVGNSCYDEGQIIYKQGADNPFYNNGKYKCNQLNIKGIVEMVDELPSTTIGWSNSWPGRTVLYNGRILITKNIFENNEWKSVWMDETGNIIE